MDVLLSAESCKMKSFNVGSYPQHISHWFDTDCQEMKQELRKCFRYFRKSKDKCRAYKCHWWWLFLAYEGLWERILLNQAPPVLLFKVEISAHQLHTLSQDQSTVAEQDQMRWLWPNLP